MNNSFEEKVLAFIKHWKLLEPGDHLLVAVSGGKDSMALLHFLSTFASKLKIKVSAANMDHGLRGNSGKEEAEMIGQYCHKIGIPFHSERRNVMDFLKSVKNLSLEQAARKVRYDFLNESMQLFGANKLAVAHNLDDLVETILMRLTRGTGLRGITGMKPMNGNVVRPLLSIGVQEILNYVTINMIPFADDPTNSLEVFDRNYLRLRVIPLLKELNPKYADAIWRFFENVLRSNEIIDYSIKDLLRETICEKDVYHIEIDYLKNEPEPVVAEYVRSIVTSMAEDGYPPSHERIQVFKSCLYGTSKSWTIEFKEDLKSSRAGKYVFFYRNELLENYKTQEFIINSLPFEAETNIGKIRLEISTVKPDNIDGKFLSISSLENLRFPLKLRTIRPDDEIISFGMKGRKKVSKILKEKGMIGFMKKILVLENQESQILWVPSIATGELCRIAGYQDRFAVFSLERR